MTTKPDNILLWAYYGDNHKGFCIEFNPLYDLECFTPMCGVGYPSEYPSIDLINDNYDRYRFVQLRASCKSPEWINENEWRTIKHHFHGNREFDKKALQSIIFGVNTSKEDKMEVIRMLKDAGGFDHVILKQAIKSQKEYKIEIINYDEQA